MGLETILYNAVLLVLSLGSEDFSTRERAEVELAKIGQLAMPALNAGVMSQDIEISSRCRRLRCTQWLADLDRVEMPWIDCLETVGSWLGNEWIDIGCTTTHYLNLAGKAGHNSSGPVWANYREATRQLCKDMIANGSSMKDVDIVLTAMWEKHRRYNYSSGRYELPPPELIDAPKGEK